MSLKRRLFYGALALGAWLIAAQGLLFYKQKTLSYEEFHSVQILDRHGLCLRTLLSGRRGTSQWVPLKAIPHALIEATLIAEDRRFYQHHGIDFRAIGRAAWQNTRAGRIVSGGSTLTQQLVRTIRNYPRRVPFKILEAGEALLLENLTSKKAILAHYLNRAPYGNQCYGVSAAARLYFHKPPAHLSLAESALLAALPQSPSRFDPYRRWDRALARQRWILKELLAKDKISREEFERAVGEKMALVPKEKSFQAPHHTDWIVSQCPQGKESVETTLDLYLQKSVEDLTKTYVATLAKENVTNAAVLVLDNETHEILAMVGSVDYFDDENDGQVNGVLAPRPPGSTWKPFLYGIALEQGWTAAKIIPDLPLHALTEKGDFTPRNFDEKFHGPVRLRTALACSYNVPAVRVVEQLGVDVLLARLRDLGFSHLTKDANHYGLGLTLGGADASLLELVCAYSTLANNGALVRPKVFLGENEPGPKRQIYSPEVAALLTDILSDKDARAPAFGPYSALSFPFPCAVKTGTSKNFRDLWTVGYTRDYTVGVWVGNFNGDPTKALAGATGSAPLFRSIVFLLHQKQWPGDFKKPSLLVEAVCPKSGLKPNAHCPATIREYFLPGTVPQEVCQVHQVFAIDLRNNLLARSDGNPRHIRRQLFDVYPPDYRLWCVQNQVEQPPTEWSSLDSKDAAALAETGGLALSSEGRTEEKLTITYPDQGDVFVMDPILRREYQAITLTPSVPSGTSSVSWVVDGKLYRECASPFVVPWRLVPGEHLFKMKARIGGQWRESPAVKITVVSERAPL